MEFSQLVPLKPNVQLQTGSYQYVLLAHLTSLIGGFFAIISGLMRIFDRPIPALIAFLVGTIIFLVEWGSFCPTVLKSPQTRGIIWLFATLVASFGLHFIPIILLFVGGTAYLVYDLQ